MRNVLKLMRWWKNHIAFSSYGRSKGPKRWMRHKLHFLRNNSLNLLSGEHLFYTPWIRLPEQVFWTLVRRFHQCHRDWTVVIVVVVVVAFWMQHVYTRTYLYTCMCTHAHIYTRTYIKLALHRHVQIITYIYI